MILLIDNTIEGQGSSPREIRSALQQMEPDLRVVTEPYLNITPEFVKEAYNLLRQSIISVEKDDVEVEDEDDEAVLARTYPPCGGDLG